MCSKNLRPIKEFNFVDRSIIKILQELIFQYPISFQYPIQLSLDILQKTTSFGGSLHFAEKKFYFFAGTIFFQKP